MESTWILLLVGGLIAVVVLIMFLIFGLPPLRRYYVRSTGEPATATILEMRLGRWAMYSGGEYSHNVTAQQVILKLEVHPTNGAPYVAEDKFMAKAMDLMRLNEGCDLQVYIARNDPKRVVCVPSSVTASAQAPVAARAGLAMANLAEQASRGGSTGAQQVLEALRAQGIQATPPIAADDPQAKLEKLKSMLNSGLITQAEFESKKKDILARM